MPQGLYKPHPDCVTAAEFQRLLQIRLETLEDATRLVAHGQPLPVPWRAGWRAVLDILGRSRDDAVLALITVSAPHARNVYSRRIRLVKPATLKL